MFKKLCNDSELLKERYKNEKKGYLLKCDVVSNSTRNVLKLYDWLNDREVSIPLAESYALVNKNTYRPCIDSLSVMAVRSGHSNSKFPLADAQRDALAQVLAMDEGDILAINGPPGTGKTTFVLSVVASMWVNAALKEQEPPLIIAASTNNQAVTNIIEAFGKDFEENDEPLSGHWLPEIKSYGGYFPAASLESEAAKNYQTASFYRTLEDPEYFEQAELVFLLKAKEVFEDTSLDSVLKVKTRLHAELKTCHRQFELLQNAWHELDRTTNCCNEAMSFAPEIAKENKLVEIAALSHELELVSQDLSQWKQFCADEPIWLTLLNSVPLIARKRRLLRELFIEGHFSPVARSIVNAYDTREPETALSQWIDGQREAMKQAESVLERWNVLLAEKALAEELWRERVLPLIPVTEDIKNLDDLDKVLDISLRFKLFQLAVHYWEARWLLDCREQENDLITQKQSGKEKMGLKLVRPRWLRRMKLTPCIVSTLHSLPGHMTFKVFEGEGKFRDDYLINEIDLLIVDEAGQVAPDVAAASFALAKRALVIGDVHQIKPVSNQSRRVDVGNLLQHRLSSNLDEYSDICAHGRSVVDGSVMRIAQSASQYRYLEDAEPGMFLREHRRCFDEIISFCNDLCYQGLLQPKRGKFDELEGDKPLLPALGYLHIDGMAESPVGGSCINRLEAETIARWLAEKRSELEKAYDAKLEDLVGVITPFKAQERLLAEVCRSHEIRVGRGEGEMTIGTVHALQGAERKVVLFSAVYSRHNNGGFIDNDPSMLNVAVSRAKDSFLVFGDMDVISSSPRGTPRHLLGQYLFAREDSELSFAVGTRPDLVAFCPEPRIINGCEEHDRFILELLDAVQHRLDMVSPWILLPQLTTTGYLNHMQAAVERGIEVYVHTDYRFNTHQNNQYNIEKNQRFKQCCEALCDCGVQVYVVNQVHSKLVMADERVMCVGSYNWGSAAREGKYQNMETSMLYSGNLAQETQVQLDALQARVKAHHKTQALNNTTAEETS
ncbi:putative superfamily I DNA helicase [Serratia fonticola AU-P3(3)]|nr:putative superfamily I DNA helicase [Serratia fonticola AU-P3(3)]